MRAGECAEWEPVGELSISGSKSKAPRFVMRPLGYTFSVAGPTATATAAEQRVYGWLAGQYVHTGGITEVRWEDGKGVSGGYLLARPHHCLSRSPSHQHSFDLYESQ